MDDETRNSIIHNGIMVGLAIFFYIYFQNVQNSPEMRHGIIEYSYIIPVGQILAFEGYLGLKEYDY